MATVYSSWVGGDDWRVKMDYSVSNSSNTTATVTITASVQSQYGYTKNTGCRVVFACGSQSFTANISHSLPSWTTFTLGSHSFSVSRTTSTQNVGVSAHVSWPNTSVSAYRPGVRASSSVSISARPSYTISYNANGGTGAPGNQTKWYGTNLVLSSTKPTRTGYTFKNWSTDFGSGNVYFEPGGTYTYNSAATLYANWTANTWTVSYDANGGEGAPESQTKTYGETLVLSSVVPTRTNYNFKGWAISSTGSVAYQPGGDYTDNAAVTLYAVWEIAYIAPIITNVAVDRCDSAGTLADDGTYLKVSFNYQLDATYSGGMDYIQLGYKLSSATSYTNLSTYNPTEMSGSFTQVFGSGAIDTEYAYDVQIVVKDHKGNTTLTRSVGPMSYIIDFSPQGGIGIGVPAPNAKSFDIQIPFTNTNTVRQNLAMNEAVGGAFVSGRSDIGLPMISDLSRDALYLLPPGTYLVSNTAVNGPISGYYGNILVGYSAGNRLIAYLCYDNGDVWTVRGAVGAGGALAWAKLFHNQDHIHLENNRAILGRLTSGSYSEMLRMNTSNQVELTWTSGGLRGRVMKQLWSGTVTTGSINVPELPYYNLLAAFAGGNYPWGFLGARMPGGTYIVFYAISAAANAAEMRALTAEISGTTLNFTRNAYENSYSGFTSNGFSITRIYGIL